MTLWASTEMSTGQPRWSDEDIARKSAAGSGDEAVVRGSAFSFAKALKKPKNTICVTAEVKRKDPIGGEICKIPNDGFVLEELSSGFHDAKVNCCFVIHSFSFCVTSNYQALSRLV